MRNLTQLQYQMLKTYSERSCKLIYIYTVYVFIYIIFKAIKFRPLTSNIKWTSLVGVTSYRNHSISFEVTPVSRQEGFPWFLESGGGVLLSRRTKAEEQRTEQSTPPPVSFYPFLHPPPSSLHPPSTQHKCLPSDTPLRSSLLELSSKTHSAHIHIHT